jgi:transcription elongation factor Elf1
MSAGAADEDEFTFRCPECGETLSVNTSMKAALIERGCVICSADVSSNDFLCGGHTPEN